VTNLLVLESMFDALRITGGTGDNAAGAQAEYRETVKMVYSRHVAALRMQRCWIRHVYRSRRAAEVDDACLRASICRFF